MSQVGLHLSLWHERNAGVSFRAFLGAQERRWGPVPAVGQQCPWGQPRGVQRESGTFWSLGGDCAALWPAVPFQPALRKHPHPPFVCLSISLHNLRTSYQMSTEPLSTKSQPMGGALGSRDELCKISGKEKNSLSHSLAPLSYALWWCASNSEYLNSEK